MAVYITCIVIEQPHVMIIMSTYRTSWVRHGLYKQPTLKAERSNRFCASTKEHLGGSRFICRSETSLDFVPGELHSQLSERIR